MIDALFCQSLGTIVVAAAMLVMVGRMVRMPAIVVYLLAGILIGPVLGWVEMGPALTFSSTVVVVKLLDEKGELDSLYGRIAVGIFLVQDLVVILILTFLAGMTGGEDLDAAKVAAGLGKAFGGMTLLLGLSLLASRYLLPRPFRWACAWMPAERRPTGGPRWCSRCSC